MKSPEDDPAPDSTASDSASASDPALLLRFFVGMSGVVDARGRFLLNTFAFEAVGRVVEVTRFRIGEADAAVAGLTAAAARFGIRFEGPAEDSFSISSNCH